jgi:hypothetical protein
MRQCQRLTIWSGCPTHAKEKTGRWDPRLTIFVRGPTDVDPKVGDPRLTQRGPRVDLRPITGGLGRRPQHGLRITAAAATVTIRLMEDKRVCVECLTGKQNKPTLFKVTEPSSVPHRTPPACAKRAAYPDPPPVILLPESIADQAAYAETLLPGSAPARNVSRYWGSPRACHRIPCCFHRGHGGCGRVLHRVDTDHDGWPYRLFAVEGVLSPLWS